MNEVAEIAGRYRLERRLGFGGMSTVQLAFDTRLERYVAVKLLAEHLADDPTFVSRFQREAMAAARLVHANVVQVFDSGLDVSSGRHFIVMEYIQGKSCAELLREYGRLTVDDTVAIIGQACDGLDYAHRNGVVHRDVKPGNLLRADDGVVKLADFGIAKATEQSSITQVGSVLGTAAYLAPEQARGEEAGPRADIYALGVVSYQLLSGRLPYEATSLTELALRQQQERPPLLDELVPELPPTLADAVAHALAIDDADRYQTAGAMRTALEDGARGIPPDTGHAARPPTEATRVMRHQTEATRAAPKPRRPRPGPPRRAEPAAPAPRPRAPRRGRRRGLLFALVLLALVAGAAIAVLSTTSSSSRARLNNVIDSNVQQGVQDLKTLVQNNIGH